MVLDENGFNLTWGNKTEFSISSPGRKTFPAETIFSYKFTMFLQKVLSRKMDFQKAGIMIPNFFLTL